MLNSRVRRFRSGLDGLYHEYPHTFWVLIAGNFIDRLGTNLIMPFLAVYVLKRFNADMTQIGLILTVYSVAGIGGTFLAGAMADRFGRRAVMIIGLVVGALARVAMGLAASMQGLYAAALVAGFFGVVSWPAMTAMLTDILPEPRRADGFGIQRVTVNLGWVLGPLIGGLLAPITGYLLLFILDALTSFVMAGIIFFLLPETRPEQAVGRPAETVGGSLGGYRLLACDGFFMAFMLVIILILSAYQQMYSTLSVYLVHYRNMAESFYGVLLTINAGMVVLVQFPITRWTSKRAPLLVMIAGTLMYLVGLTAYALVGTAALYMAAIAVVTLGEMLVTPTAQALVALLSPKDMRARYAAAFVFTWYIPQALAPLGAGVIMDHLDPRWVWVACGLLCAVSMAGLWALHLKAGGRLIAETVGAAEGEPVPAK